MHKKIKLLLLLFVMGLSLVACNQSEESSSNNTKDSQTVSSNEDNNTEDNKDKENLETSSNDLSDKLNGEDGLVRWVRGYSGNLMMTMAREMGYLDEYGLTVNEVNMQTTDESFAAVAGDQVDIVSNAGTNGPLQRIAVGDDLVIFGGHMVEGGMWVLGGLGQEWNGVKSLIGKKVVGNPNTYVISGPLLELGYDPINDIEWIHGTGSNDGIAMVKNGTADYVSVGTSLSYQAKTDPDFDVTIRHSEIMPNYSCCRMETASRFIEDKPNTTKALLKALLRGMKAYHDEPELAVDLLSDELDTPREFVEAYVLDEGYKIHPDPMYNACVRAWAYIDELGFLDENAENIDLRDHITVELYKEALDEVIEEVGDEDPEYWEEQLAYFEEHNSMYFDKAEEEQYYEDFKNTMEENRKKNKAEREQADSPQEVDYETETEVTE